MNTALDVSIAFGKLVLVILTSAWVVLNICGTFHEYEPVFEVEAMIVFHAMPLLVEYSIFTLLATVEASQVIV